MKRLPILLGLTAALAAHADEAQIRQALAERYPGLKVMAVKASPVTGLFEVWAGGRLAYVDAQGDYLLAGPLVATRSHANLTQQRLDELQMVKFDSLPLDKAIKVVKGKGERRLAVFSDPDCPYCKRLEQELDRVDNVTVYVFLNPIPQLHPQALARAEAIWCAADRARSWHDYMIEGKAPAAAGKCETPVHEVMALAEGLGMDGTPALVFGDGRRVEGTLPADRIEVLLN